jgi:acetyl esterase/lipase
VNASRFVVALAFAVACHLPAQAQSGATMHTIEFARVGGRALRMDLHLPASPARPSAVVVWVFEGGWAAGSRSAPPFVLPLLDRGVAVAAIDYRLTTAAGQYGAEGVTFPAQIHDVKAAIRYLREQADAWGLDPARIGIWGASSGGFLAALAGTSGNAPELEGEVGGASDFSSRVQAVVDYYGPSDLLQQGPDARTPPGSTLDHDAISSPASLLLGFSAPGQGLGVLRTNAGSALPPFPLYRALAERANPLSYIDAGDPPFLIMRGSADTLIPIRQSERLRDALREAGVAAEFDVVAGAGHGGFPASVHARAIDFFSAHLQAAQIPLGEPAALSGAWFDPATSGQGLELLWLQGDALAAVFYGHRDDGSNLFLAGVRAGRPSYGASLTFELTATRGGRFGDLDPAQIVRQPWGQLQLTIEDCNTIHAHLAGDDGSQSLRLIKLAGLRARSCD